MFINTISNSKRDTFKQCKLKYRYKYVDKFEEPDLSNTDALHFGSYIHKIFEDGVQASKISELETISEKVKSSYKFAKSYDNKVERCLKNFLRLNASFSEVGTTEQHFDIEINDGITLNGYIDRIIKGKEGGYLVIDYKTSKREKSKIDLYQDDQLKGYVFAVHKLYGVPLERITAAHYYPLTDNLVTVSYSSNQIRAHIKKIVDDVWKIRKMKKCEMSPMVNEYCNWCAYKSYCPEFNDNVLVESRVSKAPKKKYKN